MKKIIILKIFIIFICLTQVQLYASIENRVIAKVGDQIVTSYELINKIKTILFLNKQSLNQGNINSIKQQALILLIDNKIKIEEIKKYNLSFTQNNMLQNNLDKIAKKFNTDSQGLKELFTNNTIDYAIYKNDVETDLLWNTLIFKLYEEKISFNEKEVENDLKKFISNQEDVEEYKLSEIEILINDSLENKNKIAQIQQQIKDMGFENAAMKFSISATASEGGDLGWINSKSLSEQILTIISKLKVNEISKPIITMDKLLFLKLIDKKKIKIKENNLDTIREKIINEKKNEYLQLFSNNHLSKIKNNKFINVK
jgi:peptidyl-prolyl cis-trans isomerase SurA